MMTKSSDSVNAFPYLVPFQEKGIINTKLEKNTEKIV